MKKIVKIAGVEFYALFYSPIGWLLMILFVIQGGLAYIDGIQDWLIPQELGGQYLKNLNFLTEKVFAGRHGMFAVIIPKLYLYLPLLTMGLMSREISSGTIKLLYSSPVKVREIIFGKFLAMMEYNLLLTGILALFTISGLFNLLSPDRGILLSGLLAIYLLLCTYAAIGLFMSCLTAYQVVAALSTLVLFAALHYIGTVWQDIDFVRDLTWFLSIGGRTERMLAGMISTRDVLYFIVIIYIFLALGICKLQAGRASRPAWIRVGRYMLVVVSALAIGYISSRPRLIGYLDVTATKSNTLSVNMQKIIKELGDEPLEVTSYINLLDGRFQLGQPGARNEDVDRWEPYVRFKPDIKFSYVYFYDSAGNKSTYQNNPGKSLKQLAEKNAGIEEVDLNRFKTPEEIRRVIDLRPEQNRYVMHLKYKDRSTFLRLYNDNAVFPFEPETGAALERLLQTRLPKIAFATGELERSIGKTGDRDYKTLTNDITFRYSLVNQGFDVETVSLKDQAIPTDIAALVIADPRAPFDTPALSKLQRYVAAGGNLLVAGEPGKQAILNPLLQSLGVRLMEGQVVQQSKDQSPELLLTALTGTAAGLSKMLMGNVFADSLPVTMRGAAGLTYILNGAYDIRPLLLTDKDKTWNQKDQLAVDSAEVHFSAPDGNQRGPFPTALRLIRSVNGREQRIVVTGDADFLSNSELGRSNIGNSNFNFSTAIFSWFTKGQFPIDTPRPKSKDNRLLITEDGVLFLQIFFLGFLPLLLLIAGSILLIRRRRQ